MHLIPTYQASQRLIGFICTPQCGNATWHGFVDIFEFLDLTYVMLITLNSFSPTEISYRKAIFDYTTGAVAHLPQWAPWPIHDVYNSSSKAIFVFQLERGGITHGSFIQQGWLSSLGILLYRASRLPRWIAEGISQYAKYMFSNWFNFMIIIIFNQ